MEHKDGEDSGVRRVAGVERCLLESPSEYEEQDTDSYLLVEGTVDGEVYREVLKNNNNFEDG